MDVDSNGAAALMGMGGEAERNVAGGVVPGFEGESEGFGRIRR